MRAVSSLVVGPQLVQERGPADQRGADDNRPATVLLPARVGTRALVPKAT